MRFLFCVLFLLWTNTVFAQVLDVKVVRSPKQGIEAWLVEDHTLPVISLSLAFPQGGTAFDPPGKDGLSCLTASLLDEGAGRKNAKAFQTALETKAIEMSFSCDRNALTGTVRTITPHKQKAFALLRLALTKPRFDAEAIERMRAAAIARLQSDSADPAWLAQRLLNAKAFAGHSYGRNSGGTLKSLTAIERADIQNFAQTRLTEFVFVGVAGDITSQELGLALDNLFENMPPGIIEDVSFKSQIQNQGRTFVYPYDGPQSTIVLIAPGLAPTDSQYATWEVLNYILGGAGFGSRLMTALREEEGLTYGVYTASHHLEGIDTLRLSTATANATAGNALALIHAQWRSMYTKTPSAAEMAAAKATLKGKTLLFLTSTTAISDALVGMQRMGLPPDHLDKRQMALESVTPQDVLILAQRVLDPHILVTIIIGHPKGLAFKPEIVDTIEGIEY